MKPDDAEFDAFFSARAPQLRRVAYLIVHDWHVAEDVVQTTFVKLYAAWPRLRRETLEAYARRAVVNASISYARKAWRELPTAMIPDSGTADPESSPNLLETLQVLPPAQRAVIALRFLDDLSVIDVAAALGISEGAVKSQTSRGLAVLRHLAPTRIRPEGAT